MERLAVYVDAFKPVKISRSRVARYGVNCPKQEGQLFVEMPPLSEGVHSLYHQTALRILGETHPTVQYLSKMGQPLASCAYFMPAPFETVLLHSLVLSHTEQHHHLTHPGVKFLQPFERQDLAVQGIMRRLWGVTNNPLAARLRGTSLVALGGDGKMGNDQQDYIVFGTLPYMMEVDGKMIEGCIFEVLEYPQHIKDWRWFVHRLPEIYFWHVYIAFVEEMTSFLGMSADCATKKLFHPKEDNILDQMILEMYAENVSQQQLQTWKAQALHVLS
jgi:hypothetical protein